jgi:transcriptional regulator with XRE-family HTH domain
MRKHNKRAIGIGGDAFLAAQLTDPKVRHHFEQRRLVHEVAIAVRSMRMGAGLTQAQLAKRIGTTQPTIARLEKGIDVRTPRWDTLQRIARALGRQLRLKFAASSDDEEFVEIEEPVRRQRRNRTPAVAAVWRAARVSGSGRRA